jgi:hypothetical protein
MARFEEHIAAEDQLFRRWVRGCCPQQDDQASHIVATTLDEELSAGEKDRLLRQPRISTLALAHRLYHAILAEPQASVPQRKTKVWAVYQQLAPVRPHPAPSSSEG